MTQSTAVMLWNGLWDGDSRVEVSSYFLWDIKEVSWTSVVWSLVQRSHPSICDRYLCRTEPIAYRRPSSCVPAALYVGFDSIRTQAEDLSFLKYRCRRDEFLASSLLSLLLEFCIDLRKAWNIFKWQFLPFSKIKVYSNTWLRLTFKIL